MTYALDTNTISYWIQNNKDVSNQLNSVILRGNTIVIPPIAYYEIRRGFKHKSAPAKEKAFNLICKAYGIGEMSISVWEQAADIYASSRKAGKPIEDTDILVAAFCIVNRYILVTNNAKHFDGIDGLSIENWTISN